jgi:hypothetical protein
LYPVSLRNRCMSYSGVRTTNTSVPVQFGTDRRYYYTCCIIVELLSEPTEIFCLNNQKLAGRARRIHGDHPTRANRKRVRHRHIAQLALLVGANCTDFRCGVMFLQYSTTSHTLRRPQSIPSNQPAYKDRPADSKRVLLPPVTLSHPTCLANASALREGLKRPHAREGLRRL